MMIRLTALQTFRREIRHWCLATLPLLFLARLCSSHPRDWCLFWFGWKVLTEGYDRLFKKEYNNSLIPKKKTDLVGAGLELTATTKNRNTAWEHNNSNKQQHIWGTDILTSTTGLCFPNEVLVEICSFLHPKDVTTLACLNMRAAIPFINNQDLWKRLWYRDYGHALLQWKIGRRVLAESLGLQPVHNVGATAPTPDDDITTTLLEARLSQRLDAIASLKEFYFVFGEVYINYILAGRNTLDDGGSSCILLGLHGHILNFTPFAHYHPGLIEPILLECGRDATRYFEDLPHSLGARSIARRLVVLVNRACVENDENENEPSQQQECGLLYCPPPPEEDHRRVLQRSNTRPPPRLRANNPGPGNNTGHIKTASQVLPSKPRSPTRRPPTLGQIRKQWDIYQVEHTERLVLEIAYPYRFFWNTSYTSYWRVYYDPFQQEWKKWDASSSA